MEWWSYAPEDFLLFSERVYWRLFELHNAALWPLALLALPAGAALALGPGRRALALLAALWAFVGWSFLWERYATINWAASYVAPLFWLEAALIAALAAASARRLADAAGPGPWRRSAGVALVALGVAGYPLLAPLRDRPWSGAELFGLAPDPTAVATLGALLMVRGAAGAVLMVVPVLWCLASGATLWTMGAAFAWVAPAAALLAVTLRLPPFAHRGAGSG